MKATEKNRARELQKIVENYDQDRDSLIPLLQEVQGKFGYVLEESVEGIAKHLNISQASIYGVATFFTQFKFTRPGDHMVCLCRGTACHVKGADQIIEHVERHLHIKEGDTSKDGKFSLETVACIGCCALAPCMTINQQVHGRLTPKKAISILKTKGKEEKK